MTTQLAMFGTANARRTDPATSVNAGQQVDLNRRCAETLWALERVTGDRAGATAAEVAAYLLGEGYGWAEKNVVSKRLGDLERRARARRLGEVPGGRGRGVTLWAAS